MEDAGHIPARGARSAPLGLSLGRSLRPAGSWRRPSWEAATARGQQRWSVGREGGGPGVHTQYCRSRGAQGPALCTHPAQLLRGERHCHPRRRRQSLLGALGQEAHDAASRVPAGCQEGRPRSPAPGSSAQQHPQEPEAWPGTLRQQPSQPMRPAAGWAPPRLLSGCCSPEPTAPLHLQRPVPRGRGRGHCTFICVLIVTLCTLCLVRAYNTTHTHVMLCTLTG